MFLILFLRFMIKINSLITIPLEGNGLITNSYYGNFSIGEPPQYQSLLIDTASLFTFTSCENICINCGKHNFKNYNMKKSITHKILNCNNSINKNKLCQFHILFADNSIVEGILIKDIFTFKNIKLELIFGCLIKETNKIYNQPENGLFGLSNYYKENESKNFLFEKYNIKAFEYYFGENGGFLNLYNSNESYSYLENNTIIINFRKHYKIEINDILIDNISIFSNNKKYFAILDTGSTINTIPEKLYNNLIQIFLNYKNNSNFLKYFKIRNDNELEFCYYRNNKIEVKNLYKSLPNINFIFEKNQTYILKPRYYLFNISDDELGDKNSIMCIGFEKTINNEIILGNTFMMQNKFFFNLNEQILIISKNQKCTFKLYYLFYLKNKLFYVFIIIFCIFQFYYYFPFLYLVFTKKNK